jgi:thiol-disulfide isomerase/thioredoxin
MMKKLFIFVLMLLLLPTLALAQEATPTPGETPMDSPFAGRADLPAPEFPLAIEWLNVAEPLTMQALRGKIVLLDFWTYGCINCIHMIPVLEQLEEKYPDELVIIGVHSAKFANEGQTESLRQIVQRYELAHPVINDSDFLVWRSYGARAWPTFVVIDPRGNVLAMQAGEIPFEAFDRIISGMVTYFDSTGELDRDPIPLALEGEGVPPGLLAFPGKVMVDAEGGRLFIADTNHHRIVITSLESYEVLDVIGTGARGADDGAFDAATFNKPHGMALREDTLYVADTENHLIRAVDLASQTVSTVAGTGEQSRQFYPAGEVGAALETAISSPWDVALGDDNRLYIAMAGPHQLWDLALDTGILSVTVGSGREGLVNASLEMSELAQPSGLYYRDGQLYFADSESSTVRVADMTTGTVSTISGTSENNLFDFGDVDGESGVSRLQHPLAVVGAEEGVVYIADTYNSRIKRVDLATNTTTTAFGLGSPGGYRDGSAEEAEFDEPGGLAYHEGTLFVADTNNHAIRAIDLEAGTVETVTFPNPEALQIADQITVIGGNSAADETLVLDDQTVAPGDGEIVLRIMLPEGYKLNPDAPSRLEWNNSAEAVEIAETVRAQAIESLEVRVPVTLSEGEDVLFGVAEVYYCEAERESLCFIDRINFEAPVTVSSSAAGGEILVERTINPPEVNVGGI